MSTFFKYEDCAVTIDEQPIYASNATFSMSSDRQVEKLIDGTILKDANGKNKYVSSGPIKGQFSLQYFANSSLTNFYDILSMDESPMSGTLAGIDIAGMYLTNMSFSVEPFAMIPISLTFDVYGPIYSNNLIVDNDAISSSQISLLNGATSFISGVGVDGKIDYVTNFDYNISAQRNPHFLIGETTPSRVTIDGIEINSSINGEKFGDDLSINGNNAELTVTVKDLYNDSSYKQFGCTGEIMSQQLEVSSEDYLKGNISVKQVYK